MADVVIEHVTDVSPLNRYLGAIAVCNSLALLASQGTLNVYLQRMRLLKRIKNTWTNGDSFEIALTKAADASLDEELQLATPKETWSIHLGVESLRIEVDEAGTLPDSYQSEEDVKDKILIDIKQVKKEKKHVNNRILRANGSKLQRSKAKTKVGKSSSKANTPRGRKNRLLPETLSTVPAEERTTDDTTGSTDIDFICTECGLNLRTFVQLKNHREQEHATDSTEIEFICTECGLNLRTFVQLKNHREQEHATDDATELNFICTECGLHLKTFVQLKNHREKEHDSAQRRLASLLKDVIRRDGNCLDGSNKANKHKKRDNDCEHMCPVCNKKFSMRHELRQHAMIHSGERPYMCNICGKRFRVRSILTGHMKIHLGDKRYSCSQCGKSFVQSSSLKDHMAVHSKIRTHICNVCGKDFYRITRLNYHMRSHTGEKPYLCAVCEKRFALSRQLTNHLRMHSNEWPYSCDVCSKKFKFKHRLNQHKKLHQEMGPFSCGICPKEFTQAGSLRVHMRTHSDKTKTHLDFSQGLGCWGINMVSPDFA